MKFNNKKAVAWLSMVMITATVFAGCSKAEPKKVEQTSVDDGKPKSFTMWVPLHVNHTAANVSDVGEILAVKELEKRTNTKVTYTSIPFTNENDQKSKFNIMIASGDIPDAFIWSNKGPDMSKLISNQVIIKLNDFVDKNGTNIKKEIDNIPGLKKQTIDDNGILWNIPSYINDLEFRGGHVAKGMVRRDWLKKLNLSMPDTVDDWYNVLKAFKEKDPNGNGKKDEIPYSGKALTSDGTDLGFLTFEPFGINASFYQVNGVVKYGAMQPEYKKGLAFGKKLFDEGLIDADALSQNDAQVEKKILNDQVGASWGRASVRVADFKNQLKDKTPNYDMALVAPPKGLDGKRYSFVPQFEMVNRGKGIYISSRAKNPQDIIKWIDYQFTDEGSRLMSSGLEGVNYNLVNNVPVMKPEFEDKAVKPKIVTLSIFDWAAKPPKSPDGVFPADILSNWLGNQALVKEQSDIRKMIDTSRIYPSSAFFPEADMTFVNTKKTEIDAYVNEMYAKFLLGNESLDNFDKYVDQLKKMGIEDLLKKYQSALDLYNKRK